MMSCSKKSSSDTTPTIALIGAGQIGCRHLQSLAASDLLASIWVIDPQPEARLLVEKRLAEMGVTGSDRIRFSTDIGSLPNNIDVAIVATSSFVRRDVIDRMLAKSSVDFVVLEKFLFPRLAEYDHVAKTFSELEVKAFVNCPRRLYPGYQSLKKDLSGPVCFKVVGSNWGLACNSVHWLDILNFLAPADGYSLSCDLTPPRDAKRPGYVEFFGRMVVNDSAGNELSMECKEEGPVSLSVEIDDSSGGRWEITEQVGKIHSLHGEAVFPAPFQSQLTAGVIRDLLEKGTCGLTNFDTSAGLHRLLLTEFLHKYNESMGVHSNDSCPIT